MISWTTAEQNVAPIFEVKIQNNKKNSTCTEVAITMGKLRKKKQKHNKPDNIIIIIYIYSVHLVAAIQYYASLLV